MPTKKRKILIITAAVLVVAIAISVVTILLLPTATATDYAKSENWAYFAVGDNKKADLFIVAPTVYLGKDNIYNMSLEDEKTKSNFLGALNMERGIYEEDLRMFAPYYRQASLDAYELTQNAEQYFNIAYNDVKAAFLHYMAAQNNGRPFVLAGFSQGAEMCLRLMEEFFGDSQYQDKLIAAYIIGWRVTQDDLNKYKHLKLAQGENDTGVIVTFNSEAVDVQSSMIVPEKTYAINPLNWKTDSTPADKSLNLGACFTDYSGGITKEVAHLTAAYIDPVRGTLKVPDISPDDYPPGLDIFEPGVYHLYDYQFFFRNLQQNVSTRVEGFLG
ncbi:MAG: DUF3089 domain-containing protein [Oscillospiraceae bacterium]|jgi:hypothetical protein|nr:DUF3089 domain-containing protein [Oscillospiraceae bacterium]